MRRNHVRLRVALGVVLLVEAAAWYFDAEAAMALVAVPAAVLTTLVMLYLPRTPLQSSAERDDAPSGRA